MAASYSLKKNYLNTFEEYILGIKLFQYIPKKSIKILSIVDNSIISGKLSKFDHITHIQIDDLSLTIDEICDILQNPNNSDKQDPYRVWEIDRKIKDEIIKELEKKRKTKKNNYLRKRWFKQTRKNIKKEMKELGAESSERGAEFSDIFLYNYKNQINKNKNKKDPHSSESTATAKISYINKLKTHCLFNNVNTDLPRYYIIKYILLPILLKHILDETKNVILCVERNNLLFKDLLFKDLLFKDLKQEKKPKLPTKKGFVKISLKFIVPYDEFNNEFNKTHKYKLTHLDNLIELFKTRLIKTKLHNAYIESDNDNKENIMRTMLHHKIYKWKYGDYYYSNDFVNSDIANNIGCEYKKIFDFLENNLDSCRFNTDINYLAESYNKANVPLSSEQAYNKLECSTDFVKENDILEKKYIWDYLFKPNEVYITNSQKLFKLNLLRKIEKIYNKIKLSYHILPKLNYTGGRSKTIKTNRNKTKLRIKNNKNKSKLRDRKLKTKKNKRN